MLKDLKTLYANLLPYRDMINDLNLIEVGNGLLLKINDVSISDMPKAIVARDLRLMWDAVELNITYDSDGTIEYSAISIYANDTFIGEILL